MELDFYKIHTCQNDLIVVNYLYRQAPPASDWFPTIARAMCSRHLGVGGNALVVLLPGTEHPVKMLAYRPDGEPAAVYNDALLCMSRLAFDSGITGGERVAVECTDGVRTVDFIDSGHFRVALGSPTQLEEPTELEEKPDGEYQQTIEIDGKRLPLTPLRLHYPAAVVFTAESVRSKLLHLSRQIHRSPAFSPPVHPIFCRVYSSDEIEISTWFRRDDVDFSSAAATAAVAAILNGLTDHELLVHCNRQEVYVQWVQSANEVFATSAADYLFSGTYYFEEENVGYRGPAF